MIRHWVISLAILLLALPVIAQDPEPAPLVFFGDTLMLMDEASGEIEAWPACAGESLPRMAPDGRWLALLSADYDLRLCDLDTRAVETIEGAVPGAARVASQPAWSPDGAQVAWLLDDGDASRVAVYDLEAAEARILIDDLTGFPVQVLWGHSGIALVVMIEGWSVAALYSPDGDLLQPELGRYSYAEYFWVTDAEGREYLGVDDGFTLNTLIDPETGYTWIAEAIELYAPAAPEGVTLSLDASGFDWVINQPGQESVYFQSRGFSFSSVRPPPVAVPRNIGIAPDGQAVVIFDLPRVVWRDGAIIDLPPGLPQQDYQNVSWSPLRFRVRGGVFSGQG